MTILDKIVRATHKRVELRKEEVLLDVLQQRVEALATTSGYPFERALTADDDIAFICEVKKASPSKGVIVEDFPYLAIARAYEQAGAAAISVLTEPQFFQGSPRYLQEIAAAVNVPVLCKDFIVDLYQVYEAKSLGAQAVLLIASLFEEQELASFVGRTHDLGMSALVEVHTGAEVQCALAAGARVIGVNNRDLATFEVDLKASLRLREQVPPPVLFVSESGIHSPADVQRLRDHEVDAVLVGESLMRATDKRRFLAELRGEVAGLTGVVSAEPSEQKRGEV